MNWVPQASTSAQSSDAVFLFAFGLCVAFLLFITVLMIVFVVKYGRKRHPRAEQIEGHTLLEIVWTVIPLILFLVIFQYGWTNYEFMHRPPRDAMAVEVTARQWAWSFRYPNGKQTRQLYAPIGRPMRLDVRSADVIHGLYVAAFRLKVDAVPARTNTTWFQATRLGDYDLQCTVICGVDHSAMLSKVVVVPEPVFRAWYFGGEDAPEPGGQDVPPVPAKTRPAQASDEPRGLALLRAKGCLDCHSLDGSPMVGPTLKGVYGRREVVLAQGRARTLTVDEARLRRAILEPGAEVVEGYPPSMPAVPLDPQEVADLVAYLRGLR